MSSGVSGTSGPQEVVALDSLGAEVFEQWQDLCTESGAGYFGGPLWAQCWYEAFGQGGATEVGTWRTGATLDAVAAIVRSTEPLLPGDAGRFVRAPRWQVVGSDPGGADHVGLPCRPGRRDAVLDWLLAHRGSLRLSSLGSTWTDVIERRTGRGTSRTRTYATSLDGSPRPGSKKLWKHIARSRRQLVEAGVEFDALIGSSIAARDLEQLFALHGTRSDRVGRRTTFTTARLGLHASLAERSTQVHTSFMVRARADGEVVGALYGFADPARLHYFQSGWIPSYEKASLGSILIGEAIDLAVERGATTFDFLRGDEPYKARFGATVVEDVSVLVPRGASGALLSLRDRVAARRRR